jgi:predicted deacylase
MTNLSVGELTAQPGQKVSGLVAVTGTDLFLPVTLVAGPKPGKTVLISSGVHSAECVGIAALQEFCRDIEPSEITGNLIVIRLMNTSGFEHRGASWVYEDQKNLNRVFPGKKDGTVSEVLAYNVAEKFFKQSDYYIDLHSGDNYESLVPMVFSIGNAPAEAVDASRKMAEVVDVQYLVVSKVKSGGSYNYAGSLGVPSIIIERGDKGLWSAEEVSHTAKDVRNVLRHLGVYKGEMEPVEHKPKHMERTKYLEAPASGLWYPTKHAGDTFKEGELIGEIRDYFGKTLCAPCFEFDGVILYQVSSLNVIKGENLVAYGA